MFVQTKSQKIRFMSFSTIRTDPTRPLHSKIITLFLAERGEYQSILRNMEAGRKGTGINGKHNMWNARSSLSQRAILLIFEKKSTKCSCSITLIWINAINTTLIITPIFVQFRVLYCVLLNFAMDLRSVFQICIMNTAKNDEISCKIWSLAIKIKGMRFSAIFLYVADEFRILLK